MLTYGIPNPPAHPVVLFCPRFGTRQAPGSAGAAASNAGILSNPSLPVAIAGGPGAGSTGLLGLTVAPAAAVASPAAGVGTLLALGGSGVVSVPSPVPPATAGVGMGVAPATAKRGRAGARGEVGRTLQI